MDFAQLCKMLVCPLCKEPLAYEPNPGGYICENCAKVFPIRDGIPVMLIDEAIPLEEWRKAREE